MSRFPTSIRSRKSASIQPRSNRLKFGHGNAFALDELINFFKVMSELAATQDPSVPQRDGEKPYHVPRRRHGPLMEMHLSSSPHNDKLMNIRSNFLAIQNLRVELQKRSAEFVKFEIAAKVVLLFLDSLSRLD